MDLLLDGHGVLNLLTLLGEPTIGRGNHGVVDGFALFCVALDPGIAPFPVLAFAHRGVIPQPLNGGELRFGGSHIIDTRRAFAGRGRRRAGHAGQDGVEGGVRDLCAGQQGEQAAFHGDPVLLVVDPRSGAIHGVVGGGEIVCR